MQCSDVPGVNAYHVEGRGWVLSGDELNFVEFRGQHANIRCCGNFMLALSSDNFDSTSTPSKFSRPLLPLPLQEPEHAMHGSWHNAADKAFETPKWDGHLLYWRGNRLTGLLSVLFKPNQAHQACGRDRLCQVQADGAHPY